MTRPFPPTFKPEHTVLAWTVGLSGTWVSYVIPAASAAMVDEDGFRRYLGYPELCRFAAMLHEPGRKDGFAECFSSLKVAKSYTEWIVLWRGRMTRLPWQDWLRQSRPCGQQEHSGEQ